MRHTSCAMRIQRLVTDVHLHLPGQASSTGTPLFMKKACSTHMTSGRQQQQLMRALESHRADAWLGANQCGARARAGASRTFVRTETGARLLDAEGEVVLPHLQQD